MRTIVSSVACALALTGTALAGSPGVGQPAPELGGATWVMNDPGQVSIADLRGEVVFVEKWGVNCGPCLRLIPHVQDLQEEFGERGLHIFAFEAQGHGAADIIRTVTERGGESYPVSAGGGGNYRTDGGIPHGWLIGVEGTVIWEGNPGDANFDRLLREEMAKVRFPGLGRNEFSSDLNRSLQQYLRGNLGRARAEAQEVLEGRRSSDEARADAEYLVARYQRKIDEQFALAERYESERRYFEAAQIYEWASKALRREPEAERAEARLEAFGDDEGIEREIEASQRLAQLRERLRGEPEEVRRQALSRFAEHEDYAGTRAAEEARR